MSTAGVAYTGLSDDAIGYSGMFEEFNDPETSSDAIGSGPELGGEDGGASTYDDLDDSDVVNLTGQSEFAMVPTASRLSQNVAGSGQPASAVASISPNPAATDQIRSLVRSSGTAAGSVLSGIFGAPRNRPRGSFPLVQSQAHGMSVQANMLLFFILGILLGVILLPRVAER